jgi:hypothetical protein
MRPSSAAAYFQSIQTASQSIRSTTMKSENQKSINETLASDVLHGVKAMANYIGLEERQVFYAIEAGHLPVSRIGRRIVAFKSVLQRHLRPEA